MVPRWQWRNRPEPYPSSVETASWMTRVSMPSVGRTQILPCAGLPGESRAESNRMDATNRPSGAQPPVPLGNRHRPRLNARIHLGIRNASRMVQTNVTPIIARPDANSSVAHHDTDET